MWRTIISQPMWRTIISRPMSGHARRSWNSGFVFYAVDSAFHLLGFRIPFSGTCWIPDSNCQRCGIPNSLSWITNSTVRDSRFHQQKFPGFQNPVILYMGQHIKELSVALLIHKKLTRTAFHIFSLNARHVCKHVNIFNFSFHVKLTCLLFISQVIMSLPPRVHPSC